MSSSRRRRKRGKRKSGGFVRGLTRAGLWLVLVTLLAVVGALAWSTWTRHRPAGPETLMADELDAFCIDVFNGNGRRGEARAVASRLRAHGFRVEEITNAERFDYPRTLVIDRRGDARRAATIADALGGLEVVMQRSDGAGCDFSVVLGHDWSPDGGW